MKMQKYLAMLALLAVGTQYAAADVYDDDIYYNPKKDKKEATQQAARSNYIANFEDMDVDEYNRRGQYYVSPIDTVGERIGAEDDFVYTQQIQKYYNPTIVVDNANVLGDVLSNSYGNVEIVVDNGNLAFMPASYYYSAWPYSVWDSPYYSWYTPYNNWRFGIGWNSWWGPSWSIGWGPAWGYTPTWGYGPSWGWGPSYGPVWGAPYYAEHRPAGNRRTGASGNWAQSTRPVFNGGGGHGAASPATGGSHRGMAGSSGSRPGSITMPSTGRGGNHRQQGSAAVSNPGNRNTNNSTVKQSTTHSRENNSTITPSRNFNNGSNHRNSGGSYNSGSNHRNSGGGYNSGSRSTSGRSSGGSYGGGRSTSGSRGGGGGGHRR